MSGEGFFFNDPTPEELQQQRVLAYARAMGQGPQERGPNAGIANAGRMLASALISRGSGKRLTNLGEDRSQSYARALGNALGPSDNSAWDAGPEMDASGNPGQLQISPRVGAPLAQRLAATMNPDLMKQAGPALIQQQMNQRTTLSPDAAQAAGFRPGSVVQQGPTGEFYTPQQSDTSSPERIAQEQVLKASPGPLQQALPPDVLAQQEALKAAPGPAPQPSVGMTPAAEAQAIRIDQAKAIAANAPYDPETIDFMAKQALSGDKSVFQQLGYGGAGQQNRAALRNAVTKLGTSMGISGPDLAALNAEFSGLQAGERTLGNRTANIEMAATEAQQMAPLALQASAKVDRTQFPTLNSLLLAAEKGTGGEDVVRLGVATNSLINIYARAISPTGVPTVSDKDHARELLSSAWAKGQYSAGIDQMMKELGAARAAPGAVRGEFRNAISGGNVPGAAPVPGAPSVNVGAASPASPSGPTATGPNGQKLMLQNGQWVPVK